MPKSSPASASRAPGFQGSGGGDRRTRNRTSSALPRSPWRLPTTTRGERTRRHAPNASTPRLRSPPRGTTTRSSPACSSASPRGRRRSRSRSLRSPEDHRPMAAEARDNDRPWLRRAAVLGARPRSRTSNLGTMTARGFIGPVFCTGDQAGAWSERCSVRAASPLARARGMHARRGRTRDGRRCRKRLQRG